MKDAIRWHALIPRPITGPQEALAFVDALHTTPLAARSNIRGQLREFGLVESPQLEQRLFL